MKEGAARRSFMNDRLQLAVVLVLAINTLIIFSGLFIYLRQVVSDSSHLAYKQELARGISDYNQRLALNMEVYEVAAVREALAEYNYEIETAASSDELILIILEHGRKIQDLIFREADAKLKEQVLELLNLDMVVRGTVEKTHLRVRVVDGQVNVAPERNLAPKTVQQVTTLLSTTYNQAARSIDVEIANGRARFVVTQTVEEQVEALNEDLNTLRLRLNEVRIQAGLAEMVGPGIILAVYDAKEQLGGSSLVHDGDIRDIVNELFSSAAQGVSVGGQRITATSSIRCSGPLIMVNFVQVSTNPVIIEAVGDPLLLVSGLKIIREEMEKTRGLEFRVSDSGFIKLPAFSPGS